MTDRIEFIDAKSNKVNSEKSALFASAFKAEQLEFPVRIVSGLPTLMKRKDDGWFIVDANNELFHLKMVKGNPYVKKIRTADGVYVKHIICADLESDEYYAVIVSGSDELYTLNKKDYGMSRFPVDDYNPEKDVLTIIGNQFTKSVLLSGPEGVRVYTVGRDFNKMDEYKETLAAKDDTRSGNLAGILFPFHINLDSPFSSFIKLTAVPSSTWYFLLLNAILVVCALLIIRRNSKNVSSNVIDLAIIAVTGIFGFLAVRLIPNKQY